MQGTIAKRFASLAILLVFLLSACGPAAPITSTEPASTAPEASAAPQVPQEASAAPQVPQEASAAPQVPQAVWISFYEITPNLTRQAFASQYAAMFDTLADFGINAVFVHVRPFSDAIYPSEIFPWSDILTGTQGKNPGYDPLGILCELARQRGLRLHAWINPFRVTRMDKDLSSLAAGHPALAHGDDGWVREAGGQYFWNPAVPEAHSLIYDGARELLRRYTLAGIHIDDYFYPTTAPSFDKAQYEGYLADGGVLGLHDWRREMISQFVAGLYRTVKQENPAAVLSVSPVADMEKNANLHYADVPRWLREPGYADWIIPQIYFGFENSALPFEATAKAWAALPRHEGCLVLPGLAAYKAGLEDAFAGAGKDEWKNNKDIIAREVAFSRSLGWEGFALFSYRGLFGDSLSSIAASERDNLQKLLTPP